MPYSPNRADLQKIVILNPKGGCGKTTLATNLASYFALRGPLPTLLDCDSQGFSMRWLERRRSDRAPIHGIAAYRQSTTTTQSWHLRIPAETRQVIIDTPAAVDNSQIHELIYDADNIIIPVMPSAFDIRFAAQFIANLLLVSQVERGNGRLSIVANRTRANTRSLRQLMRFVNSLRIPVVATLRDSQNYVRAAGRGIGIYELPYHQASKDIRDLVGLIAWLEKWQPPQQEILRPAQIDEQDPAALPLH
jgi:chromosome partitioning protein